MLAYKFRSSSQIQYALDIIRKKRLFCSRWKDLNDPMEGVFSYTTHANEPHVQKMIKEIGREKQRYRVCSLASDFQSHLLWAHYAGGFDGLAIELDLPENHSSVVKVDYRGVFAFLDMDKVTDENEAARLILSSKYQEWAHEEEIRILSESEFFELPRPISRIIVGHRMKSAIVETLQILCEYEGIEVCRVGIGDEGIDADYLPPIQNGSVRLHYPRLSRNSR